MDNMTHPFDTWFETLRMHVGERTGTDFNDEDSVRSDYEEGRDVFDVIDEIAGEYGE